MAIDRFKFTLDRIGTPVGEMLIVQDEHEYLRALDWQEYEKRMYNLFERHYGKGAVELIPGYGTGRVVGSLKRYIAGELDAIDTLKVETEGTEFQRQVWRALREIPCGQTWSYGELARHIGKPGASRAVGMANGANPIGVVVPCHRVIGSNHTLTGYGGGLERKRWLLAHEGVIVGAPRQSALF